MSGSSSDRQQQEGELRVSDVSGHTAPLFRQREDVFLSPVFVRVLVFLRRLIVTVNGSSWSLWLRQKEFGALLSCLGFNIVGKLHSFIPLSNACPGRKCCVFLEAGHI